MNSDINEIANSRLGTYNNYIIKSLQKTVFETSNFEILTNKFNLRGDEAVAGSLDVKGLTTLGSLFAGSSRLISANISGNADINGTTTLSNALVSEKLVVRGATTLDTLSANTLTLNSASVSGNAVVSGKLDVTGVTKLGDNLVINGGNISSDTASQNINIFKNTMGLTSLGGGNVDISNFSYTTTIKGHASIKGNLYVVGNTVTVNSENLTVKDKVITLNSNNFANTSDGCGISILEANIVVGNILMNNTRDGYAMTAPGALNGSATIPIHGNLHTKSIMNKSASIQTIEQGGLKISNNLIVDGSLSAGVSTLSSANILGNTFVNGASTLSNVSVTGTLGVTGVSTLSNAIVSGTLGVTGATTLSNTLVVTGNQTNAGDLAVNGGDLTTTASTFNLINTNSTTTNIAGAATTVNIGASTGTTAIKNNTTVAGSLDVAGATYLSSTLDVSGNQTNTGGLALNGGELTTTASTFNLINNNATTTNIAGDATKVNIGAPNGITTIKNNATVAGNAAVNGKLTVTGNTTLSSDLTVAGNLNFNGGLSVNGGYLTTTSSTFNLINTNVTIANIAGAANVVNIGAVTGTTAINNNATVAGTLGVLGATNLASTLDVSGNQTNSGDLAVNGGDITTTATTFNLINTNARTINFGGSSNEVNIGAANGTTAIWNNETIAGTLGVSGATTLSSSLTVIGNQKNSGDLEVNGGDITTTASTFNLINTNATTTNIAGASTAVNIGAATGTTAIKNNATIAGALGVTGASTLNNVNVTGSTTLAALLAGVSTLSSASVLGNADVTGVTTLSNNLVIKGGNIISDTASQNINLFDKTTGLISLGGGHVDIGALGYVTTIKGDAYISGNLHIQGNNLSVFTENLKVRDTVITLNSNGNVNSSAGCGIEFNESNKVVGSILMNNTRDGYIITAPGALNGSATLPIQTNLHSTAIMNKSSTIQTIEEGGLRIKNNLVIDGTSSLSSVIVSGNTSITGATTLASTLAVSGNQTNAGDLEVNGGDITTTASTFNLINTNATTTNIAGASTAVNIGSANGVTAVKNNATVAGTLGVTGATTLASTLAVSGNQTNAGDLEVNGGDITTTASTFNLINTNATTTNIAGASTAVNIGSANGTTAVKNNATIAGTLSAGATNLNSLSILGNSSFSGKISVNGATTFNDIMLYKRNLVKIGNTNFIPEPKDLINGYFLQTGAMDTALNFVLPDASSIINIINNPTIGTSFTFTINNKIGENTRTIIGGSDKKMDIDEASVINHGQIRNYLCIITGILIPEIKVLDNHSLI